MNPSSPCVLDGLQISAVAADNAAVVVGSVPCGCCCYGDGVAAAAGADGPVADPAA